MNRVCGITLDHSPPNPAPSRAARPSTFAPRGIYRPPRTLRVKWPLLLAMAALPIAILVGVATATMNGALAVLIYPVTLLVGSFLGNWTATARDGFAGGFMAGWGGYFLGTLVGVPLQVAMNANTDPVGFAITMITAIVAGAVFGILFGLIAGIGGVIGAKAMKGFRPSVIVSPPNS